MPTQDPNLFRRALGQFPTGVTVITAPNTQGEMIGMTASSFNTVSLEPPLILWSVARSNYGFETFVNTEHFVVNVLGKHQSGLSNRFAKQGEDKFAGVDYSVNEHGCAILDDCAGHFECRLWDTCDGGDHVIIIGEVEKFRSHESVMPLVFCRGSYALATPQPIGKSNGSVVDVAGDGFLSSYTLYLLNQAHSLYSSELYPLLLRECNVTAAEWRILTLLKEVQSLSLDQIANLVRQPEPECRRCLDMLVERDLITLADSLTSLTEAGQRLAADLQALAEGHEKTVLRELDADQQNQLIHGLNTIIRTFNAASQQEGGI